MPILPPAPGITIRDLETLMDAFAYLLQNDSRTSNIAWVIGEIGMGTPGQVPFAYINPVSEGVSWYTADGVGTGGLAASLDDWVIPLQIIICSEPHRYVQPVQANPGAVNPNNPFALPNLGAQVNYLEQPGWRLALSHAQNVKKVLRTNVTAGGAATDTRIVESRYFLQEVQQGNIFRAARLTIQTQQRRTRGN